MFALPIFMLRVKSINFYQKSPKIELFQQKKRKIFKRLGLSPQTPKTALPIANTWLRVCSLDLNFLIFPFSRYCSLKLTIFSYFLKICQNFSKKTERI